MPLQALGLSSAAPETQRCLNPTCPSLQPRAAAAKDEASLVDPTRSGRCTWPQKGRPELLLLERLPRPVRLRALPAR